MRRSAAYSVLSLVSSNWVRTKAIGGEKGITSLYAFLNRYCFAFTKNCGIGAEFQ